MCLSAFIRSLGWNGCENFANAWLTREVTDPLSLLLRSNRDLRAALLVAARDLSKRKYDSTARQIAKMLRQDLLRVE